MTESNDGEKSNYVQNYYDVKGNLLRVYTGLHSPLTINGLDNVTGADTEYAVTKYSYDRLGRLLTTTDALGQVETNTYDLSTGLLETTTDRNENTVNYTYNGLGSVTSKSLSDGTNAQIITYGLTGKPLSMQNTTATISYTYNDKGLLLSETNSASGIIKTFTYDSAGNVLTMTITRNGNVDMSQSYTYDKLNRLTTVSENGTIIATYSYDNKNNRTKTIITGGETTNYSYNLANMLTNLTTGNKLSEQYTYYLNGNQKSKVSNGETANYSYDSMNRLISENNTQYTFDDFGNRLTMSGGEVTTTYSYDLNNRLIESSEENGDITTNTKFFYDNNGNQITKAVMVNQPYAEGMSGDYTISDNSNNYVALYEYNCYNQLVGVDTNGVISSYTYSPDGLRHSKTVDGNTTIFVYDNANVIEEITEDGANKYYRGIEIIKNDDGLYYLYNGQGDVSLLIDSTGNTVANYTFDAYGNQSEESTVYNPFGYRGEYTDEESGLIYLRARMYDAEIGRFINEDPAKAGMNWYVYGNNNSLKYVDPSGLDAIVANQSKNIYPAGHMSSFVQDDNGTWYFFYWGINSVSLTEVKDSSVLSDAEKLNKWLETEKLSDGKYKYDDFCYILGDFSESKDYYQELAEQYDKDVKNGKFGWFGFKNRNYNLVTRNCAQETMKGLYKGKIGANGEQTVQQIHNRSGYIIAILPNANLKNLQKVYGSKTLHWWE